MRNHYLATAIFGAGLLSSGAMAQAPEARFLEICKMIQEDAARLRCFDQAFGSASPPQTTAPVPAPAPVPSAGGPNAARTDTGSRFNLGSVFRDFMPAARPNEASWQIRTEKSPSSSEPRIFAVLKSSDEDSSFSVGCNEKGASVSVTTHGFIGWGATRVLYSVNGSSMSEGRWGPSADGKGASLSSDQALAFINLLPDNGTLLFRLRDQEDRAREASFSLGPVSNLRNQLGSMCKWPTTGSSVPTTPAPDSRPSAPGSATAGTPAQTAAQIPPSPTVPGGAAAARADTGNRFNLGSVFRDLMPTARPNDTSWQIRTEKSPSGELRILAVLKSGDEDSSFAVGCNEKGAAVAVTTHGFIGWGATRVVYSVNGGAMSEGQWGASADGKGASLSSDQALAFINLLPDNGTLFIRLRDQEERTRDASFSLGPVSNLRSQLAAMCKWPGALPQSVAAPGAPLKLH